MRSDRSLPVLAFAAILACGAPALASSCNKDVAVRIEMAPGQTCWTYRGAATTFVGDFSNGQAIAARMTGEAADYDPRTGQVAKVWRPRDPNVEGPGGSSSATPRPRACSTFRTPSTGTYRFSFSPCAMWGAPGAVRICAR